jgi:hypothetical protein
MKVEGMSDMSNQEIEKLRAFNTEQANVVQDLMRKISELTKGVSLTNPQHWEIEELERYGKPALIKIIKWQEDNYLKAVSSTEDEKMNHIKKLETENNTYIHMFKDISKGYNIMEADHGKHSCYYIERKKKAK